MHRNHAIGLTRLRFDIVRARPGGISAFQGAGIEAKQLERTRHTGAGGLVGSGAVCDDPAVFGCWINLRGPLTNLIRQYTHTPRNLPITLRIVTARAHI